MERKAYLKSRREALKKLGQLSAYAAPSVTALLTPIQSHAAASIPPDTQGCGRNGRHRNLAGANHDGRGDRRRPQEFRNRVNKRN